MDSPPLSLPRFLGLLSLLVIQPMTVLAAEIQVKPGASPSEKPLTEAIVAAATGDTLVLEPGVYREQVRVEKPLTIRAQPGAIVDGATPLNLTWSAAEGLEQVYVAEIKHRPEGLLQDGKFIAEIRYDRAQQDGDWHWRTLLVKGTPLSGFNNIRAVWIYHPKEKRIYARFANGLAPDKADLSAVLQSKALIEIAAPGVVIEGLTFTHGAEAVKLSAGAKDCVIRRCRVTSYESSGILLTGGASHCTVEGCDITRGSLEEWRVTREKRREKYEIWRIHKDVGKYDRVGIELIQAGASNRILRNHLDRVFDGICVGDSRAESLDKPLPDPYHGRDTEIAENVIENTRDSGIELGVGCVNVNVHHNTLRRTHGGFRFKVPRIGPVFIHHNRLIDGIPFNFWFSMDSSTAEGYVYHNTIVGGDEAALVYSSFSSAPRNFATPKWHFLNNLALTKDGFFEQNRKTPAPDFIAAHNVSIAGASPWPGDASKDQGSLYGQSIAHDETGKPSAGSTAIDAGLDLSTYLKGKPLPGCEPGHYQGKAPDAGADELPVSNQ